MAEGQYKFSISLDNTQLDRDIKGAQKKFEKLGGDVKKVGKDIDASLKEAMEGFTPPPGMAAKVEEAKRSYDGLNMATQNLVRELPAASIGLNTFFLAISNNIPIYADQVKLLAQRNRELAASGKQTVSVIRQMGAAFFSWQTAMMAGITALSMFGSKLFGLSKEEEKVATAVDEEARKREQLNSILAEEAEIMTEHERAMREEYVMVNKLVTQYANATTTEEQRYRILEQLRDISPDIVSGINDEADAVATLRDNLREYNEERLVQMTLAHLSSTDQKLAEDYAKAMASEANLREQLVTARNELIRRGAKNASPTVVFWSSDINAQKSDEDFNLEDEDIIKSRLTRALETDNLREVWDLIGTMDVGWSNLPTFGARQRKVNTANLGYGVKGGWAIRELAENYALAYDDMLAKEEAFNDGLSANATARERILENARKKFGEGFMVESPEEDKYTNKLEEFKKKLMSDATKADIDSMEDGLAKKLSQINYDYDKEEAAIKQREKELADLRGGFLTDGDKAMISSLRKANETKRDNAVENIMNEEIAAWTEAEEERQEAMDKAAADWDDYLLKYGSLRERYKALQSKYEREIAEAETEGARKALEAERDIALATMDVQMSSFAKEIVGKTTTELNAMVDELTAQMEAAQAALNAMDSTTGDDAAQYRKIIATLEAQIEALKEQLGKAKKEVKDDNWADATQTFQNISKAASDAASGIEEFDEGLANTFSKIAQLSGSAINMIGSIQGVTKALAEGMGAIEKASAILSVIGAAIQALSALMTLFKQNDEVEQTMRQFDELNKELERFRKLAQIDSIEGTIFGEDAYGNFNNNLQVLREANRELAAIKAKMTSDNGNNFFDVSDYAGQAFLGKFNADYVEALGNMLVKIRDRSDFAEFFGAKDEYGTLADLYPELFAGGEVTLEGLQKLRDSDVWEKLSQEQRDLIDELIANWERYNEATEAVTDYLRGIFGELGQEINDTIVDAFANGTDAAVAFGDVAGKMLENLITQIGYTAYIAPILSKAMADVEALHGQDLSPEEYLNALMGIVGTAMTEAENNLDAYNAYLDRADKMAEEQGINAFNGERSAAAKGIAQASQDSVDELNGRATAIQSHTFSIMESTKQLTRDTAAMLDRLSGIESNTAELRQMRIDMSAMRKDINDMATRGIVTR